MTAKVLIVDDEPSLLQVLKMNLDLEGYETLLAGDGETALRRIESESPDLVLLDIMMPVIDGWEVLRRLELLRLGKIPRVIVMTAKAGGHNLVKAFTLGADDYVTKPFEIDELLETVKAVLARTAGEARARRRELLEEWS